MDAIDPNEKITISPAELKELVAAEVRAYMEQEHECDLSAFSPEELEGIIRQFDKDEMHWGKRTMLYLLRQYGEGAQSKLHGRDDLQQFATKILRYVDKEDGLDWKRHFTKHERAVISRGNAMEMGRRTFISSFLCGAIGAGFAAHGGISEMAEQYHVETEIKAPREQEAFRRMVQEMKWKSEATIDPKAETAVGGLLIYDAIKEWNREKKALLSEKLEHIADAAQELYERTQERAALGRS